ncbi:2935_t:CDS:2, partial [Dentiscutata erythropus]
MAPANRHKSSSNSSSDPSVVGNVEQKVDEFVRQVDLEQLCSPIENSEPLLTKGPGKNNPVGRPSNCFFQFKRVVSTYATNRHIPGYNDQNILSKAQSKLWKMITEEQKDHFKKLAKEAARIHKENHPDYEFHPHRDKSNQNIITNQDSNNWNPDPNVGAFGIVINSEEDVCGQNYAYNNSTTALRSINDDSDCMGSLSQDELIGFQDMDTPLFYLSPPEELSAYPVSPTSPMLIVSHSEVPSPYPSPISDDNNNFQFVPIEQPTTPLILEIPDSNNNMLMINMNDAMSNLSCSSSPTLSSYSIQPSPSMENTEYFQPSFTDNCTNMISVYPDIVA